MKNLAQNIVQKCADTSLATGIQTLTQKPIASSIGLSVKATQFSFMIDLA